MTVPTTPKGYHSVTPYIAVDDAPAALDFYARAFNATEKFRLPMGGKIGHAEMLIGDSHVMLSDEWPDMGVLGPKARGGATASLLIYCKDVDALFAQALAAGATEDQPIVDQPWGDRMGTVVDPFGHKWSLATHVEEVEPEELARRMAAWSEGGGQP